MTNLIAIVGPTGTGKSDLAIALAQELTRRGKAAEIINADSMQFYRGMNIGTAKLSLEQRAGIAHHLIDVLGIRDESTAAEYQVQARAKIEQLQSQNVVPIVVGGSMLYVAAVLNTFEFPARDENLRAQLENDLLQFGSHAMHKRLGELDPIAASRIDAANGRRVVRAIEIISLTGKPFAASLPQETQSWQPVVEIGLNSERSHLVERLAKRVESMWRSGLVDEVESLISHGIREGKTSSRAIGYAQALAQIDSKLTEAEAISETVQLTQRYARRQMSWFKRDERINWFDYQDPNFGKKAFELISKQMSSLF